ncbi:MAG: YceH family protein [Bryobacteraceae bacterium]
MRPELDAVEARVLGALVEKEITTPEYYPLTLNALVNACNQKSNREPTVSYDEELVADALASLKEKKLSFTLTGVGMRVPKFGHRMVETMSLGRREMAILCELLNRGPQTVGELRTRGERMHKFSDLDEVESCLRGLSEREPPFVMRLERQAGMKEPRWAHLFSGEVHEFPAAASEPIRGDRAAALEYELSQLRDRIQFLEQQFHDFQKKFE